MKNIDLNVTLGIVSSVIETKNGNDAYRVVVFEPHMVETDTEVTIIDFEAKVVPTEQATVISKAMKSGKIIKMNAIVRQ
tara:strand:+ start:184 stop:420 length:237 start_codon:yes stop_codon:yes gene_type:complete